MCASRSAARRAEWKKCWWFWTASISRSQRCSSEEKIAKPLPPPPDDKQQVTGVAPAAPTEADRMLQEPEKVHRKEQNHVYGALYSNMPNFVTKPAPKPAEPPVYYAGRAGRHFGHRAATDVAGANEQNGFIPRESSRWVAKSASSIRNQGRDWRTTARPLIKSTARAKPGREAPAFAARRAAPERNLHRRHRHLRTRGFFRLG